MRIFFEEQFLLLTREGVLNAAKSLAVMGWCWEMAEDYITAAYELGIDLVLV